jgi:hypothetical protein
VIWIAFVRLLRKEDDMSTVNVTTAFSIGKLRNLLWAFLTVHSVRMIMVLAVLAISVDRGGSSEVVPLLTIPNPSPNLLEPNFGFSVAGVGGNILVGAPFDGAGGEGVGIAFLFDGTTGNLLRTISNPDQTAFGAFGWSVAGVDGNLLIGSRGAEKVYLFDGKTGALLLTIPNPDPDQGAISPRFGESVADLNGNILVGNTGAPAMVDCEGACLRGRRNGLPL